MLSGRVTKPRGSSFKKDAKGKSGMAEHVEIEEGGGGIDAAEGFEGKMEADEEEGGDDGAVCVKKEEGGEGEGEED